MNILLSTTRQWNPGDEFILRGISNLLRGSGLRFNPVAWNRHPSIRPGNTRLDNSFCDLRHDPAAVDYVIFAGTPEWLGPRVAPLYQLIRDRGLRCAFLGIGGTDQGFSLDPLAESVFRGHADLVIGRDQATHGQLSGLLRGVPVHRMPCPSLFHASSPRPRRRLEKVGVIYQTPYTEFQSVDRSTRDRLIDLVAELSRVIEVTVICNYIDEWSEASALFGSRRVRYSLDSRDFEEFFGEVDCVVGARVHGCLGAMGVGTPAVLLGWEGDLRRRGVAEEIPLLLTGRIDDRDGLVRTILGLDVAAHSSEILEWRGRLDADYSVLFRALTPLAAGTPVPASPLPDPSRTRLILAANEARHGRLGRAARHNLGALAARVSGRCPG